jgi:hypothetical protein
MNENILPLADPTMLSLSAFVQDCFTAYAAGKPVTAVDVE